MYSFLDYMTDKLLERGREVEKEEEAISTILQFVDFDRFDICQEIFKRIDFTVQKGRKMYHFVKSRKHLIDSLLIFSKSENPFISSKTTRIYLRNVRDHINFLLFSLEYTESSLLQMRTNFFSQISLEMSKDANESKFSTFTFFHSTFPFLFLLPSPPHLFLCVQVTRVTKLFTVIGTITLPLSLVAAMYGMNIGVPCGNEQTSESPS